MKSVLLSALLALALGVGSIGMAFAEGGEGAGEDAQGTRPDVLGSRLYGGWPGPYASYRAFGSAAPAVVLHRHHHHSVGDVRTR
jgi:hypothetical protein